MDTAYTAALRLCTLLLRAVIWQQRMISRGNFGTIRYLVSKGLDMTNLDYRYLMLAVRAGNEDTVEFFLDQGMDAPGKKGSIPLFEALESKHYRVARLLLSRGAGKLRQLPSSFVDEKGLFHPQEIFNKYERRRKPCGCSGSGYVEKAYSSHRQQSEEDVIPLLRSCMKGTCRRLLPRRQW